MSYIYQYKKCVILTCLSCLSSKECPTVTIVIIAIPSSALNTASLLQQSLTVVVIASYIYTLLRAFTRDVYISLVVAYLWFRSKATTVQYIQYCTVVSAIILYGYLHCGFSNYKSVCKLFIRLCMRSPTGYKPVKPHCLGLYGVTPSCGY